MLDILSFALNLGLKVAMLGVAWYLFWYIRKEGRDKIIEILKTIGLAIETGCVLIKRALARKLRKETGDTTEPDGQVKAEGTVV